MNWMRLRLLYFAISARPNSTVHNEKQLLNIILLLAPSFTKAAMIRFVLAIIVSMRQTFCQNAC